MAFWIHEMAIENNFMVQNQVVKSAMSFYKIGIYASNKPFYAILDAVKNNKIVITDIISQNHKICLKAS